MSETISISPLLDGFAVGNAISDHNGIHCRPAIKENTDKKYMLKIVSIPASQVQMDALLLAGAYKDPSEAMDYFQEKGEEVLQEAELLKKLSKLDGFLAYDAWQMEPITRYRLGYEVYLLGSYKRSLERYMRHNAVTHLEAINLGLDMCNALSVCRQAGSLYVDLKPSNIFMSEKKEYRIGDLGFLSLEALHYSVLAEKYISSYTAPELYDPMATVNLTADTYALGMILYQLYNDGVLPFKGKAPEEILPTPVHADYELAEIIMKAIHPNPDLRYSEPAEMGKDLAAYMQRNSINDVAITPLGIHKSSLIQTSAISDVQDAPYEPVEEDTSHDTVSEEQETTDLTAQEQNALVISTECSDVEEESAMIESDTDAENFEEYAAVSESVPYEENGHSALPQDLATAEEAEAEKNDASWTVEEESFRALDTAEETLFSDELNQIFAKADDLISHETPAGVYVPEIPDAPDPFAFASDDEEPDDSDIPYDPLMDETDEPRKNSVRRNKESKFADPKYKRRRQRFLSTLAALVILTLLIFAGYWFYQNLYLQAIDSLTITGDRNQITVQLESTAKDDLLTIVCLDHYGNTYTQSVYDGKAQFTGLQSGTMYTIRVEIDGFHRLTGKTSEIFTTDAATNIISFNSVAGTEDGSVVLSFTVDGDEPEHWAVTYSTDGEAPVRDTFTGHSVTVSGLSIGKKYTFTLEAGSQMSLGGNTTLELTASRLILAENLRVISAGGTDMTISWSSPGDVVVESWEVRCYNDMGYEQTASVDGCEVQFTGIDPTQEYIIEVTAAGMTQPARTGITANPINVQSINFVSDDPEILEVTWNFSGNTPDGGWLLLYTVDGGESHVVKCTDATADIAPLIPGAKYVFNIQSASGVSVFNSIHSYTTEEAVSFEANKLSADMLTIDLLRTPENNNWYCENISDDQLTDQFQSGESISLALRSSESFYLPGSKVNVLYVIRDSYGNVLSDTQHEELVWKNIWIGGDSKNGELDVPSTPAASGNYVLELYFDGMQVTQKSFTIS